MRKESVRLYISTVAHVPICLALLGLACVQLCCSYIESHLKRFLLRLTRQGLAGEKNQEAKVSHRDHNLINDGSAKSADIDALLQWLATQDDDCIEWVREAYEDNRKMREIVGRHPDHKLYAVLKPTKTENLQRIEWMLRAWPSQYSRWLCETIRNSAAGFKKLRPSPLYKN